MTSFKVSPTSLALIGISLLAMLIAPTNAAGRAFMFNDCGVDIYCATVEGCAAVNPGCSKAVFYRLAPGVAFRTEYDDFDVGIPIAMMCSHQKPDASGAIAGTVEVSQLEVNWRPDQGRTWFDISNVKGKPFKGQGESLYTNEGKTAELDTCAGGTCRPGSDSCFAFYDEYNHDRRGMRACSPEVELAWHVCRYDSSLPEYGPLDPTVKNMGFLNATVES